MQCSLIRKSCLVAESFASGHESKARIKSIKSENIRLRELGFIKRILPPPKSSHFLPDFLKKFEISFEFCARV